MSDDDQILLEESSGAEEGSADLELDAFQATEIRTIFLTTLPEYLEPVRQMLEQLASSQGKPEEIHATLDTTLQSIQTAASRVAIDDVAELVRELRERLPDPAQPVSEEEKRLMWDALERIQEVAAPHGAAAERSSGETLVAVLSRSSGIAPGAMEKLTAAGLVTVDQIRMAEAREIMAVSGLDADTVAAVLRAVGRGETALHAVDGGSRAASEAPRPSELDVGSSSGPTPTRTLLTAMLSRQAAGELELEELRGQVLRLRTNLQNLRSEIRNARTERDSLLHRLSANRSGVAEKLRKLSELEARSAELERAEGIETQHSAQLARRSSELEAEWNDAERDWSKLAGALQHITQRVDQLLDRSRNVSLASPRLSPVRRSW